MATITATLEEGTRVRLSNGRHEWAADEPEKDGGTDEGPNPYELLIGSLAACTCITLALYCRHKGIELEGVEASYEHDRVHADDCEECDEERTGYLDRIRSRVTLQGDFDDAQRARLAQIVSRCPVHKTLEQPIVLADEVSFG